MSPDKKRDFESEWALLATRLKSFLSRKNVPAGKHDDLIQETALRLYKIWDTVDRARPAWALTVTIALNLLRDEYRRAPTPTSSPSCRTCPTDTTSSEQDSLVSRSDAFAKHSAS